MRRLRYAIEAFFTLVAYLFLRLLPLDTASAFGSWVARHLGPRTKVHRVASLNLSTAMPELSLEQRHAVLTKMWDNLGRVFAEYPHMASRTMSKRIRLLRGEEEMKTSLESKQPVVCISGHLGNWEMMPRLAHLFGYPMHLLYRPPNNHVVNWLVNVIRRRYSRGLYAKGLASARGVIRAVRRAEPVAILVDQKTNNGIEAQFFGHPAMTIDVVAHLALEYNAVILPCRCIRTQGAHFSAIVEPPLTFNLVGNREADTQIITQAVNDTLERWIREDPGQWFWVHKRWPFSKAKLAA